MAELRLLRMDSILARSTLSELETDDKGGLTGCCSSTRGSVLVGAGVGTAGAGVDSAGVDATGSRTSFLCSSDDESHEI